MTEFTPFPKIPRLFRDIVITEKIDGKSIDIFKKPITDNGMKNSAKGRIAVLRNEEGALVLVDQATPQQELDSELKLVWEDGEFVKKLTFDEVRANIRKNL